jgi:peptidoglycan/xylan/chitin deacetylase (PgdA/CDA1 family)
VYNTGSMLADRHDVGARVFRALGYSRIRQLGVRLRGRSAARFVCVHDVLPETAARFEANLRSLKRAANIVSLDDFFARRLPPARTNVVVTFDDGYKGWISHALPVLRTLSIPAVFFVSSGFIGLSPEDEAEFLRTKMFVKLGPRRTSGGLSVDDVKTIAAEGHTVGGHTVNHCILTEISDRRRAELEISEDKARLEEILGEEVRYFAYPSGAHRHPSISLKDVVKAAGYKGALTTESGINMENTDPYVLHREIADADMPVRAFVARALGNDEAAQFVKRQLRGLTRRPVIGRPRQHGEDEDT